MWTVYLTRIQVHSVKFEHLQGKFGNIFGGYHSSPGSLAPEPERVALESQEISDGQNEGKKARSWVALAVGKMSAEGLSAGISIS